LVDIISYKDFTTNYSTFIDYRALYFEEKIMRIMLPLALLAAPITFITYCSDAVEEIIETAATLKYIQPTNQFERDLQQVLNHEIPLTLLPKPSYTDSPWTLFSSGPKENRIYYSLPQAFRDDVEQPEQWVQALTAIFQDIESGYQKNKVLCSKEEAQILYSRFPTLTGYLKAYNGKPQPAHWRGPWVIHSAQDIYQFIAAYVTVKIGRAELPSFIPREGWQPRIVRKKPSERCCILS